MPTTNKPRHRIQVTLTVTENKFTRLDPPQILIFDSDRAGDTLHEFDYWQGFVGGKALGFQGPMLDASGRPNGPNVMWAEITYQDQTSCVIGGILNDVLEACLGRLHGTVKILIDNEEYPYTRAGEVNILDRTGCSFHKGKVKPFLKWEALRHFIDRAAMVADPDIFYFQVPIAPDVPGGKNSWQWDWSPQDRSTDPRYQGDSRGNPNVIKDVGTIPIPRLYDWQTHRPGDYRFAPDTDFFTVWWALQKAKMMGDWSQPIRDLEDRWGEATLWWIFSQTGMFSWRQAGSWIDGRPGFFSQRDGTLLVSGKKYNSNPDDAARPKPSEWHEGSLKLRPPGQNINETFGRETLTLAEANAGRYAGQYLGKQLCDPEHWENTKLAVIFIMTGNPLAYRQLHQHAEEALGYDEKTYQHSSRTWGKIVLGLLDAWNATGDVRYRDKARWALQYAETHVINWTPYKCWFSRAFVGVQHTPPYFANEALGQLAPCIMACTKASRLEQDATWKERWLKMARYGIEIGRQPGVYEAERGGFIDTLSGDGPIPDDGWGKSVGFRLELAAGSVPDRSYINWQGWYGAAAVQFAKEVGDEELLAWLRPIYDITAQQQISRIPILSNRSDAAWNTLYPWISVLGRPTVTADAEAMSLESSEKEEERLVTE